MADSTNSNQIYTLAFKVDVSDAKGNLKEYKQYIDNLKGSLLALDKDSEQYKENSKALKDAQQKLNEVMDIAKGKGEAVAGSYDALSKQMSELKRQFKATGDEAERANLALQINDINNQLKQMDASVGVFTRNVGNYSQAYEAAFSKLIDGTSKMDGLLGQISTDVKNLIPLIKKTTTTATAGLGGIKKAIAATGIGLLVIAVGTLVTHFDALLKAVGVTEEKFQEFKTKALNVFENIIAAVVGAGNAMLQFLLAPIKSFIEVVKGAGKLIKDVFTGNFKAIKGDAQAAGEAVSNALNNGIQFKANFGKGQEFAKNLIQNIKSEVKKETGNNPVEVDIQPILDRLEFVGKTDEEQIKIVYERRRKALKAQFDEEKKLLEKAGVDTTALQKEYYLNLAQLVKEEADKIQEIQDARVVKQEETLDIDKMLADQEIQLQEDLNKQLETLGDEAAKTAIENLKKQKEDEKKLLEERKQNIQSFASSTADIIGMVADAWESSIKTQIETGKISEKEGKKQFEQVKALQTSVAIINTLSAGVAALDKTIQAGTPWGVAAGIAQMVAVIAAGMAQVSKIQSTTLGTRASQVTSVGTPNLGSIVNDYQPNYVQNITNATETEQLANALTKNPIQAYVVESSVTAKQELARSRENETTY